VSNSFCFGRGINTAGVTINCACKIRLKYMPSVCRLNGVPLNRLQRVNAIRTRSG
jgi:hypothetical protein